MQIPDRVRIGSIEYEVIEENEKPILLNGNQCYACVDFEQSKIFLDTTLTSKQRLEQSFLHEISHALLYSRSLKEEAANEILVDEIAIALHQLIIDNPILFLPDEIYNVLEFEDEEEKVEDKKEE